MPQIPVYTPQATPQELPGARQDSIASPALFDASSRQNQQLGGAIEGAGATGADIAIDIQHRQNADMIFRAETAAKTDYAKNFLPQALQRRGAAAEGLTNEASDYWKKQLDDNSANLQNTVQQHIFGEQIAKLREQSIQQMGLHEAQQRYVSLNESATASIVASTNLAAQQVGTPFQDEVINSARDDIQRRVKAQADLNGWAPEVANEKTQAALSNLHYQVIQNLARGSDPDKAEAYFDKVKQTGEWNGTMNDTVEKLLMSANYLKGAQAASDKAMALPGKDGKPIDEAGALQYLRDNTSGKTQRAAVTETRQRFADQRQAQREDALGADNDGRKVIVAGGSISDVPPDVWGRMNGQTQHELQNWVSERAKGQVPVTDWGTYNALRQAYANPATHDDFMDPTKTNLNQFMSKLGPAQFEEMVKLQTAPRDPADESLNRQLRNTFQILGWSESSNRQQMGQFEYTARQAIKDAEQSGNKRLDDDGRQKIINDLARSGKVNGSGFFRDTHGQGYEFYGTPSAPNFSPDESKTSPGQGDRDFSAARAALVATGVKNPTNAQINETIRRAYTPKVAPTGAPVGTGTVLRGPDDSAMIQPPSGNVSPEIQRMRDEHAESIKRENLSSPDADPKLLQDEINVDAERRSAYEGVTAASDSYNKALTAFTTASDAGASPDTLNDLRRDTVQAKKLYDAANKHYKSKSR